MGTLPVNATPFEKAKKHVHDNIDLYVVGASWLAVGYVLGKTRRPKVNEAKIVSKWLEDMVKDGRNIYALTNEQKALWESVWAYAVHVSDFDKKPLIPVVKRLADGYWHMIEDDLS